MKSKIPVRIHPVVGSRGQRLLTTIQKQWHNFRVQPNESAVLCASYNLHHKRYRDVKKQGAAVAMVACAFAKIFKMEEWISQTLDDILKLGTMLFLRTWEKGDKKCVQYIQPPDLIRYFFLDDKHITMVIGVDRVKGALKQDSKPFEQLKDYLVNFFITNLSGIFACQLKYYAMWRYQNAYFLFDPLEHGIDGSKWTGILGQGFGCAYRFKNHMQLAEFIFSSLVMQHIIRLIIYPCDIEKIKVVNRTPPAVVPAPPKRIMSLPQPTAAPKKPKSPVKKTPTPPAPTTDQATQPPEAEGAGEPVATQVLLNQLEPEVPPERVPPQRPKIESVTNFLAMGDNAVGVLRASTHQKDPKFSKYGGEQELANAVAALTMLRFHRSKHWTRGTVNSILLLGEYIHHEALKKTPYEIPSKITHENRNFSAKIKTMEQMGKLQSTSDEELDLLPALVEFFASHDCCIISGPLKIAVWMEENILYMFDPNERDAQGKSELTQAGVACVMFFRDVRDLVTTYFANIPVDQARNYFFLYKVTIGDFVEKAEDWYNFKGVGPDRWILRGTFCQDNARFEREYRNSQCTANAAMAITFKNLLEQKDWNTDTVNTVLLKGHDLYVETVQSLQARNAFHHNHLMADELLRNFNVDNKRVNLEIDDCLVNGVMIVKSEPDVTSLRQGFEQFFQVGTAGVVTSAMLSVAVWKDGDCYYCYDSHNRNERGIRTAHGTACLVRFINTRQLANLLLSNMGVDRARIFNISRVVPNIVERTEEGVPKPPLGKFQAIDDYRAILRSNFSEKSIKFGLNRGKQTIPICMISLLINFALPSAGWRKEHLDEIIQRGDKHYVKCMEATGRTEDEEQESDDITTINALKEIQIGTNKFYFEFEEYSQGNYKDNIQEALEGIIPENQAILESEYMTVALWKDANVFYLFDPKPRDPYGQVYGKDDWSLLPEEPEIEEGEAEAEQEEDENRAEREQRIRDVEEEIEEEQQQIQLEVESEESFHSTHSEEDEEEGEGEEEEEQEELPPIVKKGSAYWRDQEINGKGCLMRFGRIEDLVNHIIENTPPTKRQELLYSLKKVTVSNTPIIRDVYHPGLEDKPDEWAGDWHAFKEIDYGKWIIRGTKNNTDQLFLPINRGKQSIPMCLNALVFSQVYALSKFNPKVVDMIVSYGDRLYTCGMRMKADQLSKELGIAVEELAEIMTTVQLKACDYPKSIKMSDKKITMSVEMDTISGDVTTANPDVIPDLQRGLEAFFQQHNCGILECKEHTVALWTSGGVFYMFDPESRGPSGGKSQIGGACVTRFKELTDLARLFLSLLAKFGSGHFSIHKVVATEDSIPSKQPPKEPPKTDENLGGFLQVVPGKEILRGTIKLDQDKFIGGAHTQGAAIALVTLGVSLVQKPETWTKTIIDQIMFMAEELYYDSIDRLGDFYNPWDGPLDIYKINPDFQLGSKMANFALRFADQSGIVDVKNSPVMNLRQGIEAFFQENSHGIIFAHNLVLPIWEEERDCDYSIYMYDPNQRGPTGLPSPGGVACVMKFINSKVVSDHIMACLLGVDKTVLEYIIKPVEIVCGELRTKHKPKKVKSPPVKVPCPTKAEQDEQKRKLRKIVEEERKKSEKKRLDMLGRNAFYEINKEESILRGYRKLEPASDLPTNIGAFVLMKMRKLETWTSKDIDMCLTVGNQLYLDSSVAYKTAAVTLNTCLRKVFVGRYRLDVTIYKPANCGALSAENINYYLNRYFQYETFCMLNCNYLWVSIYFSGGYYYYFDPYPRDLLGNSNEQGGAIIMRYGDLVFLSAKLENNLKIDPEKDDNFQLVKISIKNMLEIVPKQKNA